MPGSTRIIPLGGLGEVGKNMTVFEADGDAVVVDAGLAFPRDEHLGVDLILPDFSYLVDLEKPVRAVLLTHGHEDHVGALPYLLREVRVQEVWATRLTLGLIKSKLDEHGLLRSVELREADPEGPPVELGAFRAEFVRVANKFRSEITLIKDEQRFSASSLIDVLRANLDKGATAMLEARGSDAEAAIARLEELLIEFCDRKED